MLRCLVLLMLALGIATTLHAGALLAPGDAFPAWTLSDQTGATVSSRDLAGKTYLLWFYPKAMTPGCTAEGDGLRDSFAAFQGMHYPAHITALLPADLMNIGSELKLERSRIVYSDDGRIPGTPLHWPGGLKGRRFSDNVAYVARKPPR